MNEAWQERVRERAYEIWQRQGSPDGHADQFWLMAEEELLAEDRSAASAGAAEAGPVPETNEDALLDEAGAESFPASDPPARTAETGIGSPPKPARKPRAKRSSAT